MSVTVIFVRLVETVMLVPVVVLLKLVVLLKVQLVAVEVTVVLV